MRPLEILIPILLAFYLIWHHPRPRIVRLLPAVTFLLTLIHFLTEGYRWQMIPLYILAVVITASSLLRLELRRFLSAVTLALLALATTLPAVLPIPVLPPPSGAFQVGTRIY